MPREVRISIIMYWLGLGLLSILSGCKEPVTQPDLVGTYVADYTAAKEALTLLADGKFTQHVTIKSSSQTLTTNGTWTFNATAKRVSFQYGYIGVLDGFGEPRKELRTSNASLPVARRFGKVQIGGDPGIEYKKQPSR